MDPLKMYFLLKWFEMGVFNCYVSLPEGTCLDLISILNHNVVSRESERHLICTFRVCSMSINVLHFWRTHFFHLFLEEISITCTTRICLACSPMNKGWVPSKSEKLLYLKGANHEHGFFNKKRALVGMWYIIISIVQSYIHTMFIYCVYILIYYTYCVKLERHRESRCLCFMLFAHPKSSKNHPTNLHPVPLRKVCVSFPPCLATPKDFGLDAMPKVITLSNFFSFLEVTTFGFRFRWNEVEVLRPKAQDFQEFFLWNFWEVWWNTVVYSWMVGWNLIVIGLGI